MNTEQNYVGRGDNAIPTPQAAQKAVNPASSNYERLTLQPSTKLQTPFQTALLFTAEMQHSKPGFAAFVCYLNGKQVIEVERLNPLRGHNPTVNLKPVFERFRYTQDFDGVVISTWHHSGSEDPYAEEFADEVYRQYDLLKEAGIKLVDNLRLSKTGVYSYYGQHYGPYSDSNTGSGFEQGICRLY
ncbi:hypothetical protein GCM10028808_10420 [Spirosoma migulaei]